MERVSYKKPSRFNAVSVLLVLALLAGVYSIIQFGPPYYRRWKAAGILAENVSKIYSKRRSTGEQETQFFEDLRKDTEQKLRDLGITSEFQIQFRKDSAVLSGTLEYIETVQHWFVGKTTTLRFYITETTSATSGLE